MQQCNGTPILSFFRFRFEQTLTQLDLSRNNIGDKGGLHLVQGLKQNKVISYNWYPTLIYYSLFQKSITHLKLGSTDIGDESIRHLSQVLEQNKVNRYKNTML